ncbi:MULTISPECIES: hypothetical protein [Salipiger]|uniref:hypothetical protein n=1 Tax=Salipiger TaxID=263377 RepID=UPI000976315F|nr:MULTISPECIES: hypothetical protein [Salipiger]GGA03532.1 hypothetical protein GCM10011326_13650 [Salipiger profundus]
MRDFLLRMGAFILDESRPARRVVLPHRLHTKRGPSPEKRAARKAQRRARAITRKSRKRGKS